MLNGNLPTWPTSLRSLIVSDRTAFYDIVLSTPPEKVVDDEEAVSFRPVVEAGPGTSTL